MCDEINVYELKMYVLLDLQMRAYKITFSRNYLFLDDFIIFFQ